MPLHVTVTPMREEGAVTHVAPAAAVLQGAPPSGHSGQGPGPSDSQRGPWNKDKGTCSPCRALCAAGTPHGAQALARLSR